MFLVAVVYGDQAEYTSSISERLHFSGEGAVGLFDTEEFGQYPASSFLVDEAKLFVEAAIFENIYIFGELNLIQREEPEDRFQLGELYIEFEDIGNLGGVFNIRIGRFDIPFGEEYLTRDAIDNPLISHSLSDIWGVDEGVEVFGTAKIVEYVLAVQNGGDPIFNDFNSDKAVVGRLLVRPVPQFHLSVSAMRTGDLDVAQDHYSEVWFGNGFIVPIGSGITTTTIGANFLQADGHFSWAGGHVHLAGGRVHYYEDDSLGNDTRDLSHYQVEVLQNLTRSKDRPWYAALRYSKITTDEGYPLLGFGRYDRFLFDYYNHADELWRLSAGIGYRVRKNLLLKAEYSFENGEQISGEKRDRENFLGVEAAVGF